MLKEIGENRLRGKDRKVRRRWLKNTSSKMTKKTIESILARWSSPPFFRSISRSILDLENGGGLQPANMLWYLSICHLLQLYSILMKVVSLICYLIGSPPRIRQGTWHQLRWKTSPIQLYSHSTAYSSVNFSKYQPQHIWNCQQQMSLCNFERHYWCRPMPNQETNQQATWN